MSVWIRLAYFDADPVQQASSLSNEIRLFVINVLKLKIEKIIRTFSLKGQCYEFPPSPWERYRIPLVPFRFFFSQIRWDIRSSRCITGVVDTGGAPWAANISANLRKKIETILMLVSGARGKMIYEKKTWSTKFRDTVPLKGLDPPASVRICTWIIRPWMRIRIHNLLLILRFGFPSSSLLTWMRSSRLVDEI